MKTIKEISFRPDMEAELLDGLKTQTRRVVKADVHHLENCNFIIESTNKKHSRTFEFSNGVHPITSGHKWVELQYGDIGDILLVNRKIPVQITSIRIERLQDISRSDAMCEGLDSMHPCWSPQDEMFKDYLYDPQNRPGRDMFVSNPVESFKTLWQSIYGKDSPKCWERNPWVWVIEFKQVN